MFNRFRTRKKARCGAAALLMVAALLSLGGCHRPTPIKELAGNADAYKDKEVRIHGRVVSSYSIPALTRGVYVVNDGTGQMGVIASDGIPKTNSEVTVTGQLQDVPPFGLPFVRQFKVAEVLLQEKEREVAK